MCKFQSPLNGKHEVEPHHDHTSTQHSAKKRVGFVSRINIRKHTSRRDMTPRETHAAWYSQEEFASITKSCCKQIQMLNQGEMLRDTKYTSRGLESHTRICLAAKLQNRADAFRVVLTEQDTQMAGGSVVDDEAIRKAYQGVSSSAQLWALSVGLQDEREAENLTDDCLYSSQTSTRIPGMTPKASTQVSPTSISKNVSHSTLQTRRLPAGVLTLQVQSTRPRDSLLALQSCLPNTIESLPSFQIVKYSPADCISSTQYILLPIGTIVFDGSIYVQYQLRLGRRDIQSPC
jgi:hypothetical protein